MSERSWYKAKAVEEMHRDGWRLFIYGGFAEPIQVLCEDGTWASVESGARFPENAGIFLPADAWAAVVNEAAPHADAGEVKELRAALALEQSRVEKLIEKALR